MIRLLRTDEVSALVLQHTGFRHDNVQNAGFCRVTFFNLNVYPEEYVRQLILHGVDPHIRRSVFAFNVSEAGRELFNGIRVQWQGHAKRLLREGNVRNMFSARDVAELLCATTPAVTAWRREGKLKGVVFDKQHYYPWVPFMNAVQWHLPSK